MLGPVALVLACGLLLRSGFRRWDQLAGLALVAGGGAANWLDRLLHGGTVTDFVSLGLGPVRTGIFNAADIIVILGVALLVATGRGGPEPEECAT